MAVLEAKAHQTKEDAKEKYQEQLSALHAKRLRDWSENRQSWMRQALQGRLGASETHSP